MTASVHLADCLEWMKDQPNNSVDLTFGSPPYASQRTYGGLNFNLQGDEWVDWMVARYLEMVRITKGLVAMVVDGPTRKFRWTATPILLMAALHKAGVALRKPPIFHRVGIAGSGGPDWLRSDHEFIVCASKGRLPWSDNVAMGHPPKYRPGGSQSYRLRDGSRVNSARKKRDKAEPKVVAANWDELPPGSKLHTKDNGRGEMRVQLYIPPEKANPGSVIKCVVGGGRMGSALAHRNEAPFPESLATFFVRSFCPPGGVVFDPFSGSGTTAAAAVLHGRQFVGTEIRQDQVDLTNIRIEEAKLRAAANSES